MEEEFTEYLVSASEKLLLEYGQTADPNDAKKQQDLVMIRLHAQYLNDIRNMQYCISLKICDLSGNFLTNIDALECCTNLIKLDLHNNQLEELPGPIFWGSMADLRLLYLHDNGISKLENVHSLSFCPNLIALTLFNTPLCLKIAYRHIVVNSILSLKALDYYVVSDEEIMEDWRLPEKYKPFTLSFFVDFPPLSGKETMFWEEMKMVRGIISKINYVLAHHSPVLIIQKWIRGYLIRKILCLIPVNEMLRYKRYIKGRTKRMYIQHRPSVHGSKSCIFHTIKPEQQAEEKKLTSGVQTIDVKDLKQLHLYLRKLNHPILSTILRLEEKKRIEEKKARRSPRKDLLEWKKTEMKEDGMATKFRLSVHRMPFYSLTEELQQHHDRDKDYFDAVQELRYVMHPVPQTIPILEPGSIDKRVFAKTFGTIRLRPLCAIDKAYWESQKLDAQLKKEREVMRMQIAKSEAQDYVNQLHEGKIEKVQKNYEEEKLMFHDILEECKRERSKLICKMRQKYTRFLHRKEGKVLENTFVQGFSTQHNSLTRGLLRLDGWRNCKEVTNEKKHMIRGTIAEQKQRKEVYEDFQEERLQMLQKQNTDEKCFRKCVTHEMSRGRLQQSKAKVEAMKKPRVKKPYTLPVIGSSGTAVPVAEYDS